MAAVGRILKTQQRIRACPEGGGPCAPWYCCVALFFLAFQSPLSLNAQPNATGTAARSNRYLLVVETSRSMQRRSEGVLETIQALLASNFGGQIRNGDTLGVWTYNEELSAGKLPVQRWAADAARAVTPRVLAFVKE